MTTHDLELGPSLVVKRFRSYARGEHLREWRGLRLLARFAPGLAPRPVAADLDGDPPWVSMSRVPGVPSVGRLPAVAAALERLHTAVPVDEAAQLPVSISHPALRFRELAPASAVARRWLGSAEAAGLRSGVRPVLGREDHNVPNFLDDGDVVRLVDVEDSGRSDRAVELASIVEHLSWRDVPGALDLAASLDGAEAARFRVARRYYAILWLTLLQPGGPSATRNPPSVARAQLDRVHTLLDS